MAWVMTAGNEQTRRLVPRMRRAGQSLRREKQANPRGRRQETRAERAPRATGLEQMTVEAVPPTGTASVHLSRCDETTIPGLKTPRWKIPISRVGEEIVQAGRRGTGNRTSGIRRGR